MGTGELSAPRESQKTVYSASFSIKVSDTQTRFSLASYFAELLKEIPRSLTVLAGAFLRLNES